ncbi:MAG: sulfite exporter TauE/SafE family protein [Dehalococcoidia bacterium]
MEITLALFAGIAFLSLSCEYMDASLGMGYGTTLTPLLLIIGFAPLEVVPAVLLGQLVGGLVGGLTHHRLGNINLDFRRDETVRKRLRGLGYLPRSTDSKVIFILIVCGIIGALVGVFSAVAIPKVALKTYIGAMVLVIGIIIIARRRREGAISWRGLIGVGLVSSFNKGISGGGYGPLVTGGQIISGGEVRSSVGNTTLAEAIVCIAGFLGYVLVTGDIFWTLAAATSIGSVVAAPFAAMTVKAVNSQKLKFFIGLVTIILGIVTLFETFVF